MRDTLRLLLVSCGGLGLSPVVPGTVGTLGGVALAWALSPLPGSFGLWALLAAAAVYAVSLPFGRWAEERAGRKDPGIFVMDEVCGYLVTIAWPASPSLLTLVVAFFVFRFFDIVKPWPARRIERVPYGHGILLDDIVAGLYGLAVMAALRLSLDLPWSPGA